MNILDFSSNSEFYEMNPLHQLQVEKTVNESTQEVSFRFCSDISLLLDERRLVNDLGPDTLANVVSMMNTQSHKGHYDKGSLTDDQLMTFIKSRYLQSPSEISGWVASLTAEIKSRYKEFEDSSSEILKKQLEQMQVEKMKSAEIPESSKSE